MPKSALVFLADGAEEMEAVIILDLLRRANIEVTLAGVNGEQPVVCGCKCKIIPDVSLESVKNETFDAVILPGGHRGAKTCAQSQTVGEMLKRHYEENKLVAAVCAGPTTLIEHKIAFGKKITSYPLFKDELSKAYNYQENETVVLDGNFLSAQGPNSTIEFALKIIEYLDGEKKRREICDLMLFK